MSISDEQRKKVKRWFEDNGASVSDWAVEHGFDRGAVYAVLNGRSSGRRGESHKIAIALGLKKVPTETAPSLFQAPPAMPVSWPFPTRSVVDDKPGAAGPLNTDETP